jgi:DNA-binding phage protein
MKKNKKNSGNDVELASREKAAKFWKDTMKSDEAKKGYAEAEILVDFVEELKEEMKSKHMSYYSVAKKAGINHQALARILNGARNAEISTLSKVARGVGGRLSLRIVGIKDPQSRV